MDEAFGRILFKGSNIASTCSKMELVRYVREMTGALTGKLEALNGRIQQGPKSVVAVAKTWDNSL